MVRTSLLCLTEIVQSATQPSQCRHATLLQSGEERCVTTLKTAVQQTRNCQVETLFSNDIVIRRNKTSLLFSLPQQTRQNIDYEQSLFSYCSQSKANNDQFRVNSQNPCSYLIKHNGHKEQTSRQPETRIMNERRIMNNCQKAQRIVFNQASL